MSDFKQYLMDDGSYLTTGVVAEIAGISRIAAYRRLKKSSDRDWVLLPKGAEELANAGRKYRSYKKVWVDDPVQVIGGIPVNPSYMDGLIGRRQNAVDRYGVPMSFSDRSALARFRTEQRNEWRSQNKESIINSYDSHKEEMKAIKRRRIS